MFLKRSDKLAIVDFDGRKINYNEMVDSIKYLSRNIFKDINKNEKVLIIAENRLEWIYSFFAIWDRLSVPIPLDALSTKEEIDYFIEDSGSKIVVVSNKTKKLIENRDDLIVYNLDDISIDSINDEKDLMHPLGNELALMIYTSGTTGTSKGVMISFNNLENEIRGIKSLGFTSDDEQVLAILPFHHIFPLVSTALYFYHYEQMYSVVLVSKLTSEQIFKCLNENDVTGLSAVPRVYKLFYKSLKDKIDANILTRSMYKLAKLVNNVNFSKFIFKKVHKAFGGKLRTLVSGGGKADLEMIEFFNTIGFLYCEGYGLSETSPVVAGSGRTNYKAGTIGKAMKGVELKIVNEELWVKSPVVMLGYYNKPDKTKEVMTKDGWFKTGDRASIDKDGFITILGRVNEMIVLSNGKNVNPIKLEERIISLSDDLILEIGIFGKNDKLNAIIVPNNKYIREKKISNVTTHIRDIIQIYNSKAHNYEKILDYKITNEELPKTRVGKLRRFMLPDMFNSKIEKKIIENEPNTEEYKYLKEYLLKLKDIENLGSKDNFEIELGLDSLDFVEFKTFIENTYNLKLEDDIFVNNYNLEKLSEYIKNVAKDFNEVDNESIETIIKNIKPAKIKRASLLAKIISPLLYINSKIYFRLSIKGKEKIKDKPTIFIANHESFLDAPLLSLALPYNIRMKTHFLGLKMYFSKGIMKFLASKLNVVTIDIEKNVKDSIENIAAILKSGENIFIFPEGSRTKDGNLQNFKKVFAILSKELDIDIQCLGIKGAYKAYSRFDKIPKPYKIEVEVLGTISPKDKKISEIVKESEYVLKKYKGEK